MIAAIDPGTTTGLALIHEDEVMCTWSGSILDAFDIISDWTSEHNVDLWVLEYPTGATWYHGEPDARKREKISRNVGSVQRDAKLIADYLTRRGYRHERITPSGTKWGPAVLQAVTGYHGRTNQHVRDAIRLAWTYRKVQW